MQIDKIELFVREGQDTREGKYKQFIGREDQRYIFDNYWFYNFNIDGNQLKPEHKIAIYKYIVPTLRDPELPCHLKIRAFTSKAGDPEYNRQLSISRALHCKKFFHDLGFGEAQIPGDEMRGFGEDYGASAKAGDYQTAEKAEYYRAVHLIVEVGLMSRPHPTHYDLPPDHYHQFPPASISGPKRGSTEWRVKYMGGRSFGGGASYIVHHELLLWDRTNKVGYRVEFDASGASGSPLDVIPGLPPLPGSRTRPAKDGEWTIVHTGRRVEAKDFEGSAFWRERIGLNKTHRVDFNHAGAAAYVKTGTPIGAPTESGSWGKVKVGGPLTGFKDTPKF